MDAKNRHHSSGGRRGSGSRKNCCGCRSWSWLLYLGVLVSLSLSFMVFWMTLYFEQDLRIELGKINGSINGIKNLDLDRILNRKVESLVQMHEIGLIQAEIEKSIKPFKKQVENDAILAREQLAKTEHQVHALKASNRDIIHSLSEKISTLENNAETTDERLKAILSDMAKLKAIKANVVNKIADAAADDDDKMMMDKDGGKTNLEMERFMENEWKNLVSDFDNVKIMIEENFRNLKELNSSVYEQQKSYDGSTALVLPNEHSLTELQSQSASQDERIESLSAELESLKPALESLRESFDLEMDSLNLNVTANAEKIKEEGNKIRHLMKLFNRLKSLPTKIKSLEQRLTMEEGEDMNENESDFDNV